MDYSKLSDFEINKRVAICIHPDIKNWNCYDVSGRACFVINEGTPKRVQYGFSFTSDPADAWPIIMNSGINVFTDMIPHGLLGQARASKTRADAVSECIIVSDKNPLRAAMIVYLQMQESANVQDNTEG
ncbi:phage protein NinX family protein [Enterobacter hormaechei]